MQPVIRYGTTGKWERIKDKPTYHVRITHSFISNQLHRLLSSIVSGY